MARVPPDEEGVDEAVGSLDGLDDGLEDGLGEGLGEGLAAGVLFAVSVVDVQATEAIARTATHVRTRYQPLISRGSVRAARLQRYKIY